jgi:hypothetical protein
MAVMHFHKPYPTEYNLAAKIDPLIVEDIRENVIPVKTSQPVSYFYPVQYIGILYNA